MTTAGSNDYEYLLEMWLIPSTNMTTWRMYIEDMLKDDARYEAFLSHLITEKDKPNNCLGKAFYAHLLFERIAIQWLSSSGEVEAFSDVDNIDIQNINVKNAIAISEECLANMISEKYEEHIISTVKGSLGKMLFLCHSEEGTENKKNMELINKEKYDYSIELLKHAAFDGSKNALRLISIYMRAEERKKEEFDMELSTKISGLYDAYQDGTDIFYDLLALFDRFVAGDYSIYNTIIEKLLNTPSLRFNAKIQHAKLSMADITILLLNVEGLPQIMKVFLMQGFLQLMKEINDYKSVKRTLPKHRDPFTKYFDEYHDTLITRYNEIQSIYLLLVE